MKTLFFTILLVITATITAQKSIYNIELFGKKIGETVLEKLDKGNGETLIKLRSTSQVDILFTHKTSSMVMDVMYKDGTLITSYCKNVKDGVTEITTTAWNGTKYIIKKGEETLQLTQPLDFSGIQLYFTEPKTHSKIFSERLGIFCSFIKKAEGVYESKLSNGVSNIYRYKNGVLYELEMSKGASVFMRLAK